MMGITIRSEESGRMTQVNFNFTDAQNQKVPTGATSHGQEFTPAD